MVHEEKSEVFKELYNNEEITDVWGPHEGEDIMHKVRLYSGIKC